MVTVEHEIYTPETIADSSRNVRVREGVGGNLNIANPPNYTLSNTEDNISFIKLPTVYAEVGRRSNN